MSFLQTASEEIVVNVTCLCIKESSCVRSCANIFLLLLRGQCSVQCQGRDILSLWQMWTSGSTYLSLPADNKTKSKDTVAVFFFYMIEGPPALILYEFNQGQIIMPLSICFGCFLKCFYCTRLAVIRRDDLINFFIIFHDILVSNQC